MKVSPEQKAVTNKVRQDVVRYAQMAIRDIPLLEKDRKRVARVLEGAILHGILQATRWLKDEGQAADIDRTLRAAVTELCLDLKLPQGSADPLCDQSDSR